MPKVTFLPDGKTVDVARGRVDPGRRRGRRASISRTTAAASRRCTTCHCWIEAGFDSLSEIEEREDDKLNEAAGLAPSSRLGCQAYVSDEDVVVRIPGNRIAS